MKARTIRKSTYILLSVGIATLMIMTCLPYYCLSSISFPGANIYWGYEYTQRNMLILFPIISALGALSTLKKKNTIEDVFFNVASPMLILMVLKVLQYNTYVIVACLGIAVAFATFKVIDFTSSEKCPSERAKKRLIVYSLCRRRIIYPLIFMLTPMVVWVNFQENDRSERVIYEVLAGEEEQEENEVVELDLVGEKEWETLPLESRLLEMKKVIDYECVKKGVSHVDIFAVKEITDGTLGYYQNSSNSIFFNVTNLNECSLREAISTACHEVCHKYDHAILEALEVLDEAEVDYASLGYFEEALNIKDAAISYYIDSQTFESYSLNLMEVRAKEYAEKELLEFEKMGYLSSDN